ncbi:hypothetical protein [Bacillus sp. 1P06AnD]|uniref:hypothetical protein n=1 Tax=Bacillus sp. 1P06AnD TaxID=3132208 RepID=UPI00399F303C
MNKHTDSNQELEKINDVYIVMNWPLFVYLDLVLLSTFLGFLLYSQIRYWVVPVVISILFFFFFIVVFNVFFKEKRTS